MTAIELASIRQCLDGGVPATIATCAADGTPNVSYASEVHYVDASHVALSYQFFNKTRANVLSNPIAQVLVVDPVTGAQFRLDLRYLRTEATGPIFESMRVKLAGIAAHSGMTGVFRLLGSDIYHVESLTGVAAGAVQGPGVIPNLLPVVRRCSERLAGSADLEGLFQALLDALKEELSIQHAIVFLHDMPGHRLYLIASHGYETSGIGSEIPLGSGIVGICAQERTPIRITHRAEEFRYSAAVASTALEMGTHARLEIAIPLPGLPDPGSQLAVPVSTGERLLGVLYVESTQDGAFSYDAEDLLVTLANQLASALVLLEFTHAPPTAIDPPAPAATHKPVPLRVRYFSRDCSVFLGDEYLIKGVAGSIFWKLANDYVTAGRREFSNREIRRDPLVTRIWCKGCPHSAAIGIVWYFSESGERVVIRPKR